jgi:muramoyltetrapeptide carboxypeptidase
MNALRPGATIGVIAPAGPSSAKKVARIAPWLAARGFNTRLFDSCHVEISEGVYLAGSDALRLGDLHAAFTDPAVDAIICMRGGYGSARLLDQIDYALVAANAKPFVGYSDITSLHTAFNQLAGMPTVHAPMLTSDLVVNGDEVSADALFDLLMNGLASGTALAHHSTRLRTVVSGRAQGRLMGGNLSVLCAALGTPWAIAAQGGILFLEEVGEDPYRVDRMLTQCRHAGVLEAARGFVIGSFSDAADPHSVINEMLAPLGKPMLTGWQAGHCVPNYPLPFGVDVVLDADLQTLVVA